MKKRQKMNIPYFSLYGETDDRDDPAFVHIEEITERSAQNNWEIKPHRHAHFYQLLLIRERRAQISLDGQKWDINEPAAIIVPPGIVHGFHFEPDVTGEVLTLSSDFTAGSRRSLNDILEHANIVRLSPEDMRAITAITGEMLRMQKQHFIGQAAIALALSEAAVRMIGLSMDAADTVQGSDPRLGRLKNLVELHFRERRPVSFYADALAMSERNLARICQQHFNCSPQILLHRRMTAEARRLLLYSNASSIEIAEELGFDDPSYFSRFYLRMTGHRPSAERISAPTK